MKKFISLLLAMTMCMSLFAVSALADGETVLTDDQTFDFESYDAPYSFASGYTDGYLGANIEGSGDKVEVVASGDATHGNIIKVTHAAATEVGYEAYTAANYLWNIGFDIKLDDLNEVRQLAYYLNSAIYPELIFYTNGTVGLSDGQIIDDLVIETGKWYNFNVTITSYNEVYVVATTESGDIFTAVGGKYTYIKDQTSANRRLYFRVMGEQSGVYYLDNIDVTPAATDWRYGFEDFDDVSSGYDFGTNNTEFLLQSYDYSYVKGDNYTTMVAVARKGSDNALKITKGAGTTAQSEIKGWGGYKVSNAAINYDIKLMDKNVERRIIANDDSDRYVLTFKEDGTVAVCGTAIPGFTYESGADAPWYNVKIYISTSEGKVIAVISDGENIVKGEGTMTFNAAGMDRTRFYVASKNNANTGDSTPSETYVDNIIFKEFFPPAGFFTKAISFSFDDLTDDPSKTVPQGWLATSYHTFSVHNNNSGTTNGTGAVIDGRKVLSVNRLTDTGSSTNTTLRLTQIPTKYFAPDRIEFDVKLPTDTSNPKGIQVSTGVDLGIVKLEKNGTVQCLGQDAVQSVYGNWHRVAIDYDFTGDAVTYDVKVVDLDRNVLVCSYSDLTSSNKAATDVEAVELNMSGYADDKFYVDNFSLYSADAAPYVMGSTFLKKGAEPHLGGAVLLNHAVDPSNAGNKLVINGTTYIGAEANKFLDARFLNTASFTGLEEDTSYNIAYKLYDMFGGVEEGTTIFTTGENYTFGDITLSKTALTAGEVTATLTAKISADMEASLIFALYEKGGNKMIGVNLVNIGWSRDEDTYTATLNVPEDGEYEVRAFLWDDAISPITLPVTLAQ